MRFTRLATRGWKGLFKFTDGLAINFEQLPEGLIAITGENGSGKTSALEAAFAICAAVQDALCNHGGAIVWDSCNPYNRVWEMLNDSAKGAHVQVVGP